jgi:hypothetical protein
MEEKDRNFYLNIHLLEWENSLKKTDFFGQQAKF